ncbi:MAG: hypothetical protein ACRCX2_27995 [Paraclostridium sp.]
MEDLESIGYGLLTIFILMVLVFLSYWIMYWIMIFGAKRTKHAKYIGTDDWTGEPGYLLFDDVRVSDSMFHIFYWICWWNGFVRLVTFQLPIIIVISYLCYYIGGLVKIWKK